MNAAAASLPTRFRRGDHPSLRAAIGDAIRGEIIAGRLAPGKPIVIKELQAQYGVGLSAVREALCQLAADGLVLAEEQRGFRVAPISLRDLEDLTQTRIEIEALAIRDAVAHGDTDWEAELLATFHKMSREPKPDGRYAELHRTFHDLLVAPCRSEWLKRFRSMLHEHSERYRRLAATHNAVGRDIDGEHRALMDAALDHDAERAAALIGDHVRETAQVLLRSGLVGS